MVLVANVPPLWNFKKLDFKWPPTTQAHLPLASFQLPIGASELTDKPRSRRLVSLHNEP